MAHRQLLVLVVVTATKLPVKHYTVKGKVLKINYPIKDFDIKAQLF
jgi:hypothetical protein